MELAGEDTRTAQQDRELTYPLPFRIREVLDNAHPSRSGGHFLQAPLAVLPLAAWACRAPHKRASGVERTQGPWSLSGVHFRPRLPIGKSFFMQGTHSTWKQGSCDGLSKTVVPSRHTEQVRLSDVAPTTSRVM